MSTENSSPLPPPQVMGVTEISKLGYVAEKLSILMGTVRSALRRVGLVVQTVDDSLVPVEDKIAESPPQDASPRPHSPHSPLPDFVKVPGLHTIGQKFEQVLQESAEFSDSHAMQVALEAKEEDRLNRHITL